MPRRTVQEVLVQDVQKRRNPNKHYVSLIFNVTAAARLLLKIGADRGLLSVVFPNLPDCRGK